MYQAKDGGKNRFHIFDADFDRKVKASRHKQRRLQQALEADEFVLFYQPKVNIVSGDLIGLEALIRWQHPEEGILPPADFLSCILGTGLDVAVGEWVIESALAEMVRWQQMGQEFSVSVNVSAAHLLRGGFVQHLRTVLSRYPTIKPSSLELEILETDALSDMDRASQTLMACRELGLRLALDDFGTGYSSLTYLRRLPVDILKIDKSFVIDMLDDPNDLDIVEGVIQLSHAFNRTVIAEGVETLEHGVLLAQLGCQLCQGYGIARPMPVAAIADWLRTWQEQHALMAFSQSNLSIHDFALQAAIHSHLKWIGRLEAFLTHPGQNSPPEIHADQCRLGRWYAGGGAMRYGGLPEFKAIATVHEQVHALGSELLVLANAGEAQRALERLPELHGCRDRLVALLEALIKKVHV